MDSTIFEHWEAVIGLEIHVELNTKSKLFSPAPNHFGDDPNTNISAVCTGQPGSLPVLNREAVHKAVLFGCAVNAHIAPYSRFDRKSYFYPDSPRNFQITQFEMPLVLGGSIVADVDGVTKTFALNRAHLEDDAGMLKHFSQFAGVDYNRAGVPLIEIVSEPCLFSAKDAVAYATAIKAILEYLDVSDCNMDEGSLRIDANISVRPKGEKTLRNKIEIKNMNSFTFMAIAIEAEIKRQICEYVASPHLDPNEVIVQSTYRWDVEKKETVLMRRKESADDYRYFLEPDLPPLLIESDYIEVIRASLPELPYQRKKRYVETLHISNDSAVILVNDKALADYFEQGLKTTANAKGLCNWIITEFAGRYKESGKKVTTSGMSPHNIAELVNLIDSGVINGKIAKKVADLMVENPDKACATIIKENPEFVPVQDVAVIETIVDEVLKANPQSVADYRAGRMKAFGFLVGQVMLATQGKASPAIVNQLLKEKLK